MKTPRRKKIKAKYAIELKHFPVFPRFGTEFLMDKKRLKKKVNFMVKIDILDAMKIFVPAGDRSEFVNGAIENAIKKMAREEAMKAMDEFRKENKWKMTDAQIRKAINYGRK